ncbi:glutathione S-transferase [Myxococcota bacterium]|nr:glutathione S-transferase [Myxococcota bacterium]
MPEIVHYRFLMSPFCARVDAALRWKELPYRAVEVHPVRRAEIAFARTRAVPVLTVDGEVVEGTGRILRRLDEIAPGSRLYPEDRAARVRVEEVESWADEHGPPMMWGQLLREPRALARFLESTANAAPLGAVERIGWRLGAERMLRRQVAPLMKGRTPDEAVAEWYRGTEGLAEGPAVHLYLLGDERTAADLAVFSFLAILYRCNADMPGLGDFASMAAWFQRVLGESGDGG